MKVNLLEGDCLEQLTSLPDNSVDALVTDPPAGIGFMGKDWDHHKGGRDEWIAWLASVLREAYRVMKPGAHGLVWALPRTSHWTGMACEQAGFEVRDRIAHIFGSGFPKSHNLKGEWDGWGTALKPAVEDWWLVRKPCSEKTVAANVIKWGVGALNIDASRINPGELVPGGGKSVRGARNGTVYNEGRSALGNAQSHRQGRFPSHLILDEESARLLDEQSGVSKSTGGLRTSGHTGPMRMGRTSGDGANAGGLGDSGGASRFFYVAKTSKAERNAGCEIFGAVRRSNARPNSGDYTGKFPDHDHRERAGNHHPTVKPQKLMQYLITMITPPGGLVLDPFMGSGSTGVSAVTLGHDFVGIEREPDYMAIARARIQHAQTKG